MIRRGLAAASIAASVVSLSGCIVVSGTPPVPAAQEATVTTPATAASRPITHGVVGEKLSAGPWTVTIEDSSRTSKGVGGVKPGEGEDLLTVTVGFENMGTDSLQVRPDDFALTDESGASFPRAKTSQAAYNASSMRPLQPRFGTTTIFVYKVPRGSARYTFAFSPPGQNTKLEWLVP